MAQTAAISGSRVVARLEFAPIYRAWFSHVVRWIPAMGAYPGDVEDLAQDIFVIANRKLASFDGNNVGGWLYSISLREVQNHRRMAWVRRLWFKPADDPTLNDAASEADSPADALERKELGALADRVLGSLSEKHRRAYVLFEIEGYSGEEIAALEGIPVATAWTRLHHARRQFLEASQKLRAKVGL